MVPASPMPPAESPNDAAVLLSVVSPADLDFLKGLLENESAPGDGCYESYENQRRLVHRAYLLLRHVVLTVYSVPSSNRLGKTPAWL